VPERARAGAWVILVPALFPGTVLAAAGGLTFGAAKGAALAFAGAVGCGLAAFALARTARSSGSSMANPGTTVASSCGVFLVVGTEVSPKQGRPHGWPALDDDRGCDGFELWSLTTDAAEAWHTPADAWRWLRDPEGAVAHGPPAHHLRAHVLPGARRRCGLAVVPLRGARDRRGGCGPTRRMAPPFPWARGRPPVPRSRASACPGRPC
jgi:hypothetical protein